MTHEWKLALTAFLVSVPSLCLGWLGILWIQSIDAKPAELNQFIADHNKNIDQTPENRQETFYGVVIQSAWRLNGAEIVSGRVTRVQTIIPLFGPQTYADLKANDGRIFHCRLGTYGSSGFNNIWVEGVEGLPDPATLAEVEKKALELILQTVKKALNPKTLRFSPYMDKAFERPEFRRRLQQELVGLGVKLVPYRPYEYDHLDVRCEWQAYKGEALVECQEGF